MVKLHLIPKGGGRDAISAVAIRLLSLFLLYIKKALAVIAFKSLQLLLGFFSTYLNVPNGWLLFASRQTR